MCLARKAQSWPAMTSLKASPRSRRARSDSRSISGTGDGNMTCLLQILKRAMQELDADRAFADRRGDPLHAVRARIADAEDAGDAGLHEVGAARKGPVRARQILGAEIGARLHELLLVHDEATFQPRGVGIGARHEEQVRDRPRLALARVEVLPADALEPSVALERDDLTARGQVDVRRPFDALDQVAGHAVG